MDFALLRAAAMRSDPIDAISNPRCPFEIAFLEFSVVFRKTEQLVQIKQHFRFVVRVARVKPQEIVLIASVDEMVRAGCRTRRPIGRSRMLLGLGQLKISAPNNLREAGH